MWLDLGWRYNNIRMQHLTLVMWARLAGAAGSACDIFEKRRRRMIVRRYLVLYCALGGLIFGRCSNGRYRNSSASGDVSQK